MRIKNILGKFFNFIIPPHPARFHGQLHGITNYHKKLRSFVEEATSKGLVLDIGSGGRKIKTGVISFDIIPQGYINVVGDGCALPFKNEVFAGVIVQEVLQYICNPNDLLMEVKRVLNEQGQGLVFIEVPFLYPELARENDFWRFTIKGLRMLCCKYFMESESGTIMGKFNTLSLFLRHGLNELSGGKNNILHLLLHVMIGWLTFWVKYFDALTNYHKSEKVAAAFYFIGKT